MLPKKEWMIMGKGYFVKWLRGVLALCLIVMALAPLRGEAHTLWINLSEHHPQDGSTNACFGWGHRYPLDEFLAPEMLTSFELVHPDGERKTLTPGNGGYLAGKIDLPEPGNYVVAATLKPMFYTMYREDGEIHHKAGPKTGVSGTILLSALAHEYAKALVTVGAPKWEPDKLVVGHKLEIVPLEDPRKLAVGDVVKVRVLFDGEPMPGAEVSGVYLGAASDLENPLWTKVAGEEGIAKVCVQHATVGAALGAIKRPAVWMLRAIVTRPAPAELKDKCNELWFVATLTMQIG
ncbi:MAG: hypothetical protein B1H03_05370 [Planctomycetales bacterium 4484_113]|nr:MAG: hypothetical protein B1H03_05370 [Planctomycetales bacterium 4484_113]